MRRLGVILAAIVLVSPVCSTAFAASSSPTKVAQKNGQINQRRQAKSEQNTSSGLKVGSGLAHSKGTSSKDSDWLNGHSRGSDRPNWFAGDRNRDSQF